MAAIRELLDHFRFDDLVRTPGVLSCPNAEVARVVACAAIVRLVRSTHGAISDAPSLHRFVTAACFAAIFLAIALLAEVVFSLCDE